MSKEARIYSVFNKWCQENWIATCKRIKLDYFLTPCTKINSKWIKNLHVRPETIKLLEESIGSTLFDTGHSNIFLDMSSQARETKAKINKWDYVKLKSFCIPRKLLTKQKGSLLNGRKICKLHI